MSLRARIALLVGLVLLASLVGGLLLAGFEARHALREELASAMTGGRQTIASAFEDLPRSDHQERDLRQLVGTFNGNRHVSATLVGPDGAVRARSRSSPPEHPAPPWFVRLVGPPDYAVRAPTPPSAAVSATIVLQTSPDRDAAAAWAEMTGIAAVLVTAFGVGLPAIYWALARALRPLVALSEAFATIGRGDYSGRIVVDGPSELVRLETGFNAMASQLQDANARNQRLEAQMRTIQDEERAELARDLHDEIGPHLFAVNLDAQGIAQTAAREAPPQVAEAIAEQVGSIRASVSHMQRLVRAILTRLRPMEATELGLVAALEDLADFWRGRSPDVRFEMSLPEEEPALPEALKDTLYRVAQESVANAFRHSRATCIALRLETTDGVVVLEVVNDGAEASAAPGGNQGFGLAGMRERVAARGGALEVGRRANTWTVCTKLPAHGRADVEAAA